MQIFYGIPLTTGDRILTTQLEYGANYIAFLQVEVLIMSQLLMLTPYYCIILLVLIYHMEHGAYVPERLVCATTRLQSSTQSVGQPRSQA